METNSSSKYSYVLLVFCFVLACLIYKEMNPRPVISSEIGKQTPSLALGEDEVHSPYKSSLNESKPSGKVQEWIEKTLQEELTVDKAVQIAVLNNPILANSYEDLGVSQEELLEAFSTSSQNGFMDSFLDNLLGSLQKNLSQDELKLIRDDLACLLLDVITETKIAYHFFAASEKVVEIRSFVEIAADDGLEVATRLHRIGNIPDIVLLQQRLDLEEATVKHSREKKESAKAKKRLEDFMGIEKTSFTLSKNQPKIPSLIPQAVYIENKAIENNIRLQSIKEQMKDGVLLSEEESKYLWGEYRALAFDIRSAAHRMNFQLVEAFQKNRYLVEIVRPLENQLAEETMRQYNAMEITVLELLNAKQKEIQMQVKGVFANRDYFVAEAEVEMLLNGKMRSGS